MVELFRISSKEAQQLKEDTIERLLNYNRQLKLDYAAVKNSCSTYVKLSSQIVDNFAKGMHSINNFVQR